MASNRFSEITFYMLQDFWTELMSHYSDDTSSSNSSYFEDFSKVVFINDKIEWSYDGFLDWNGEHRKNITSFATNNARLVGPGHLIIVEGGAWTSLFVEKENYGYREVAVRPNITSDDPWIDDNWFKFNLIEIDRIKSGFWYNIFNLKDAIVDEISPEDAKYIEQYEDGWTVLKDIITNGTVEIEEVDPILDITTIKPIDITNSEPGKSFAFKLFNKKNEKLSEEAQLVPEDKFFLRKDSLFFEWFRKNLKYLGNQTTETGILKEMPSKNYDAWNHNTFINDQLLFNFFGHGLPYHSDKSKLYYDDTDGRKEWKYSQVLEWQIQHNSMKNFMINSLPPNNLNIANKSLLWDTMDRVYEEPYNMERSLQTLLDPEDIPAKMLPYLASFYNVEMSDFITDECAQREFIKGLPSLLKRKGSQSSLPIIWRSIIGSKNKVSFYERWHETYAREAITDIDISSIEDTIIDPSVPDIGDYNATEGSAPSPESIKGFPNPLELNDYAVLYCYDVEYTGSRYEYLSELHLYYNSDLIMTKKNQYYNTIDYLTASTQRSKPSKDNWTYIIGSKLGEMDVVESQTTSIHSTGRIIFFALSRRIAEPGEDGSTYFDVNYPDDNVVRFLSLDPEVSVYNTPLIVECRNNGIINPDDEFCAKVIEHKKENGSFSGKVEVIIYWRSNYVVYEYEGEHDWLTHNIVMNHCYKNYFGNGQHSYKLGNPVKSYNTDKSLTTYWSLSRYAYNADFVNEFKDPEPSNIDVLESRIMYNYNSPRYFAKFTANLDDIQKSSLELWWNNEILFKGTAPNDLKTYNEIKYWAQNFILEVQDGTKFVPWPKFGDRLDDMFGAEEDSRYEVNEDGSLNEKIIHYFYRIKIYPKE